MRGPQVLGSSQVKIGKERINEIMKVGEAFLDCLFHPSFRTMAIHCRCLPSLSLLPLLTFTIVFLLAIVSVNGELHENDTDMLSLLELKANLIDQNGALSSWNGSYHFCWWHGVTCGSKHQRVAVLNLTSQGLSGSLSPHIGNLSFLRRIDLGNNSLHSEIPPEIGNLRRLRVLYLNNNSFSGNIPSNLSSCSNLIGVDFSVNALGGRLPRHLGSLSELVSADFGFNDVTGNVPPTIGNLSSLQYFSVTQAKLQDKLPDSMGKLENLAYLAFSNNNLSGSIPSSIFNISSLQDLYLDQNEFEGSLPGDIWNVLPYLEILNLNYNRFWGPIPTSISNATYLVDFEVASNSISGEVPSLVKSNELRRFITDGNLLGKDGGADLNFICTLTNATKLQILTLVQNKLKGGIPDCIGNLSVMLTMFRLSDNFIEGILPVGVGNLVNLERLELARNDIHGSIPQSIGNIVKLKVLDLTGNSFSVNIPLSLGNLQSMTHLSLRNNKLEGEIPSSISECQNLLLLDLSANNLVGLIPQGVVSLSSLSLLLDLSQNNLTGVLPVEIGKLINVNVLNLSHNSLSGPIPMSISNCLSMEELYLENNFFEGIIPSSFQVMRGLRVLNISSCRLTGKIPEFLQSLNLTSISVSFNGLEGALPTKGVFSSVATADVVGNEKLCGGLPQFKLPKCEFENPRTRRLPRYVKVILYTLSVLVAITCIIVLVYLLRRRRGKQDRLPSNSAEDGLLKVSYHSLSKATGGFSSMNLIGVGSFGSVYKGFLDQTQTTVAIKVLDLARHGGPKSFIAECEALKNTRHRNLVKVITACSGVDHNGNDFKALVYEYMPNGSLDDWLHPTSTITEPRSRLSLIQRMNIAVDIVFALEYLHHGCDAPVIHCDLKPSNVLLDGDLIGHISDFGMARFMPDAVRKSIRDQTSSIGVKGSFGYIAPEYGAGAEVSMQGDVYSYGILILELFTGKRPTDDMFKDGNNIYSTAKAALERDGIEDIIDLSLLDDMEESGDPAGRNLRRGKGSVFIIQECLYSVIEIGVKCSSEVPRDRGNITDATAVLRSIRDKLRGLCK